MLFMRHFSEMCILGGRMSAKVTTRDFASRCSWCRYTVLFNETRNSIGAVGSNDEDQFFCET
jgi:hypothetical protein